MGIKQDFFLIMKIVLSVKEIIKGKKYILHNVHIHS